MTSPDAAKAAEAPNAIATVKAAAKAKRWEKIRANKAALLLAENLAASGNKDKAREACNLLINANQEEDDSYVREAAERIIAGL